MCIRDRVNPSDINEGEVISVYESTLYIIIYVSNTKFEGTVEAKYDDTICINGADYRYTYQGLISLGMSGIFYTDIHGKIAYISVYTTAWDYGCLLYTSFTPKRNLCK